MGAWRYRAFGLEVASEIEMPVLAPGTGGPAEVEVTVGRIAEPRDADDAMAFRNWTACAGVMDLDIPGVARFRIEDGRRIRVQPAEGAGPDDAVSHLQGSAFAALLQQRRVLPMHAGTIETGAGAVLFTGTSGAGKSTLLNAMVARGFRMLADDVTPVSLDGAGKPVATPAFPASRLWRDSAEQLGHDVAQLTQVRDELDKYYVTMGGYCDSPQPMAAVVVLGIVASGPARIEDMPPAERVKALVRYSFRKKFLVGQQLRDMQFATVGAMAGHLRVLRLWRPSTGATPDALAGLVIDTLELAPATSGRASAAA